MVLGMEEEEEEEEEVVAGRVRELNMVVRDLTNTKTNTTTFLHLMRSLMMWKSSAWTSLYDCTERT